MAVTKSEPDGNHPSSHYLVVEDPAKPTTWHLRYKNAAGTVDRALCGACYAALTSNYRGNPYTGPNKQQALTKLRGIYKSQGWDWPGDAKNTAADPLTSEATVAFAAEADAESVTRVGKLFACGVYPDKDFAFDEADLQRAIAAFEPVPVDLEHVPSVLDGKLGIVQRVFAGEDGTSLYGEVRLPKWLDAVLEEGERKVSATWDRATKTLQGLSLVRTPRVSDAALMAAFAADRTRHPTGQYAREDTGDGQQAMQHIHDVATAYGARQRGKAMRTATMSSTHEVRGFQSIHDTASTHGATHSAACTPATMSTDQPRSTRMKLSDYWKSKAQESAREEGIVLQDDTPDPAAFAQELVKRDAELAALKAQVAADKVQQQQQAAQFARLAAERLHSEAAAFAQGLVQSHRVPPGAADSLTALTERVMAADSMATFADGVKSTAALLAEFAAALPDYSVFTTHAIKDSEVAALFNTSTTTEPDGLDKDTIDKLLALTPDGKAMLAERK